MNYDDDMAQERTFDYSDGRLFREDDSYEIEEDDVLNDSTFEHIRTDRFR